MAEPIVREVEIRPGEIRTKVMAWTVEAERVSRGLPDGRLVTGTCITRHDLDGYVWIVDEREARVVCEALNEAPLIQAWLDEDGRHVWQRHLCNGEVSESMLPWPKWSASPHGAVTPSINCVACGTHEFVSVTS